MRKFQYFLFVMKRSYICYYIICMTLPLMFHIKGSKIRLYRKIQVQKQKKQKNFMTPFYGWGSTAARLQSHYEETVYFLPLS